MTLEEKIVGGPDAALRNADQLRPGLQSQLVGDVDSGKIDRLEARNLARVCHRAGALDAYRGAADRPLICQLERGGRQDNNARSAKRAVDASRYSAVSKIIYYIVTGLCMNGLPVGSPRFDHVEITDNIDGVGPDAKCGARDGAKILRNCNRTVGGDDASTAVAGSLNCTSEVVVCHGDVADGPDTTNIGASRGCRARCFDRRCIIGNGHGGAVIDAGLNACNWDRIRTGLVGTRRRALLLRQSLGQRPERCDRESTHNRCARKRRGRLQQRAHNIVRDILVPRSDVLHSQFPKRLRPCLFSAIIQPNAVRAWRLACAVRQLVFRW